MSLFPLNSNSTLIHNIINYLTAPDSTCVTNMQTTFVLHAFLTSTLLLLFNSLYNLWLHTVQPKITLKLTPKKAIE